MGVGNKVGRIDVFHGTTTNKSFDNRSTWTGQLELVSESFQFVKREYLQLQEYQPTKIKH